MKTFIHWFAPLWAILTMACSVIPAPVREAAIPKMPFPDLIRTADQYLGQTVVLGGYIISVDNQDGQARIVALQSPLGARDAPKSRDQSEGRLIITYSGFLDPEVYAKKRKITVAGRLLGSSLTDVPPEPFPYVRVKAVEIHLWPQEKPDVYYPHWGPYPYPDYYWHRFPYDPRW